MRKRLESSPEQMAAAVVGEFPASRSRAVVVEASGNWAARFRAFAVDIQRALGSAALRIEHVGSTSVPGLPAKPIIDIDVTVADAEREEDYVPALKTLGLWMVIREPWWHGHRMFVGADGDLNLHVWPDGAAEPIRHVLFRDWLRSHSDDRDRYASVKRELSRTFETDPDRYNLAKNEVIDDIYARIFTEWRDSSQSPG